MWNDPSQIEHNVSGKQPILNPEKVQIKNYAPQYTNKIVKKKQENPERPIECKEPINFIKVDKKFNVPSEKLQENINKNNFNNSHINNNQSMQGGNLNKISVGNKNNINNVNNPNALTTSNNQYGNNNSNNKTINNSNNNVNLKMNVSRSNNNISNSNISSQSQSYGDSQTKLQIAMRIMDDSKRGQPVAAKPSNKNTKKNNKKGNKGPKQPSQAKINLISDVNEEDEFFFEDSPDDNDLCTNNLNRISVNRNEKIEQDSVLENSFANNLTFRNMQKLNIRIKKAKETITNRVYEIEIIGGNNNFNMLPYMIGDLKHKLMTVDSKCFACVRRIENLSEERPIYILHKLLF